MLTKNAAEAYGKNSDVTMRQRNVNKEAESFQKFNKTNRFGTHGGKQLGSKVYSVRIPEDVAETIDRKCDKQGTNPCLRYSA
jgi:hypothetical protein